ncbi:MAG TPA: YceI family protein [Candidatus Saccharimonadia bacterium]|nr:YceI family protein [Candidatus Saccharimonadia bacterium]
MTRAMCSIAAAICVTSANLSAAPVHYTIDPEHTFPSLEFPHMGISVWRGRFNETAGRFTLDREARTGTVEVRVATDSIDFGLESMRAFAVQRDWLEVERFPEMTYAGTLVFEGESPVAVDGRLSLRGITRPLRLSIRKFGCLTHPAEQRERCGADAEGVLDRADYGMGLYTEDGAGRITLRIQVEALRDRDPAAAPES